MGRMDAVIHNAGAYATSGRSPTAEGHSTILAVNTLAPYMLTALIEPSRRLVYLSSGMHRGGTGSLREIDWVERRWNASQAYSDSKLYVTALAFAVARCWPDVLSNAVDPGWVATTVSELCHMPPQTLGQHGDLLRHDDAHRCCTKWLIGSGLVGFRVRQHARAETDIAFSATRGT
jgi:NAD(P)-dependent dehydrogenase (short-subunit alcohol dehydrogenase family)